MTKTMENSNGLPTCDDNKNFYLDPTLIDTNKVKRIGIEQSISSIVVDINNHTIVQSIRFDSFSDHTIKPIKNHLSQILVEIDKDEKRKIINAIITCINRNIDLISKQCEQSTKAIAAIREESNKVDELIKIVLESENTEKLFKDQYGKPFAAVKIGKARCLEILPLTSTKFKRYLTKLYRENTCQSISDSSLNTVISSLAAEAEFSEELIPLHLRVAWGSEVNKSRSDCIYYDLCDKQGNVLEISREDWRIINGNGNGNDVPILFRRFHQQPQITPDPLYPPNIFDQFLNLTNVKNPSHQHLLKVYMVSLLIPEFDHVILTTYGPMGGAKSFLLELIKKLIDPTKPTLLTLHKNIEQFIQQVNHNYINYYDNVKFIPYWLSEEICKAVTGAGHTKRQLYTDDEDIVYEHKRCMGLNGINVALTESDALDRSLFIELEEIDPEKRRKEDDLWREFERVKPLVLGHILDTIVKAMQIKQSLKLKNLPRMADFAEWGEAISQALGYPPLSFIEEYQRNRNSQNIIAIDENLVGSILLRYIQNLEIQGLAISEISFQPEELYKEIVNFSESNEINIRDRQFPKNAASLVKKIKVVIPNLKAAYGLIIRVGRNTTTNTSIITIRKRTLEVDTKDLDSFGCSESSEVIDSLSLEQKNSQKCCSQISNKTDSIDLPNQDVDESRGIRNEH